MNKMRLTRDKKWGFQYFPYHQMYMDNDLLKGWVSINYLTDGETMYWEYAKSGKIPVCGKDMLWLTIIPDGKQRCIGAYFLPDRKVSAWYIDVIDSIGFDEDGVLYYIDKFLDVILTPQGDVCVADRDELDDAYKSGELTLKQYEDAVREGENIVKELATDIKATEQYCIDVLNMFEKEIADDIFTVFIDIKPSPQEIDLLNDFKKRTKADLVETDDIKKYLYEHPSIKRYVVFCDPCSDYNAGDEELRKHLVFVDVQKGLQISDLLDACLIMNTK